MLVDVTILSYHKFTDKPDEYPFSRTYDQFTHDLEKKIFDWITIDDGMKCMVKACDILRSFNIRGKLFVCTSLIGTAGYCTWKELKYLSRFHDIENHSHRHLYLTSLDYDRQEDQISNANSLITQQIERRPRFFVPPYNAFNEDTELACENYGLILLKDRITIKNNSK